MCNFCCIFARFFGRTMFLYFWFIRIAAFFGHQKARKMVDGQEARGEWREARGESQEARGERQEARGEGLEARGESQEARGESLKGAIWIHAASSGEFEQARTLIEKLKIKNEKLKVVVTFFSPSGYEMQKNYPLADGVFYLPFATRRNARRFIETLQPSMAFFVKYEFWPAYIRELNKRGIPFYSISSVFRPNQYFFRWWGKGQLRLLRMFTHIFVQDEASRRLLAEHAVHNASVAGDTRFDRMWEVKGERREAKGESLAPIAEFAEGCERVLVAGSTWPEDEILLQKYSEFSTQHSDRITKLILVPHELTEEHLHFIFNLFKGRMVKYSALRVQNTDRFTDRIQTDIESRRNILQQANVLLVDTMGLLSMIYRFGQVAYIGGGFGEGIHNTIEAASYGLPVVFGPKYQHFREAQGLIDAGAGQSIRKYEELEKALDDAFANHEESGAKALEYVKSELGATEKIYKEIFEN